MNNPANVKYVKICWLKTLMVVCVCVCVLPNKDQTSIQIASANPAKSDGKIGNICPSPVWDINTSDEGPNKTGPQPAGPVNAPGSLLPADTQSGRENLGVEAGRVCLWGATACAGARGAGLLVLSKEKRKSLYSWLSIDGSGACNVAAAPHRAATH